MWTIDFVDSHTVLIRVFTCYQQVLNQSMISGLKNYSSSTTNRSLSLSVHFTGKNSDPKYVLRKASKLIKEKFNIFDLTIQVEEYKDEMQDCSQCNPPNFANENSMLLRK